MIQSTENNRLNGIVLLGSARSDGNTRDVTNRLVNMAQLDFTDLNSWDIGYFEYDTPDRRDGFLPLIDHLLKYDLIVFATPVYWYNMSALMKNFFDRITDLLDWHQDKGRALRGKAMAVVSCSASAGKDPLIAEPFRRTADYLGMQYSGYVATWVQNGRLSDTTDTMLMQFLAEVEQSLKR